MPANSFIFSEGPGGILKQSGYKKNKTAAAVGEKEMHRGRLNVTAKTAYVVDFDGTITAKDLSTGLARHFGGERYREIESLYRQRKIGMRGWLDGMSALLPADFDLLMAYVAEHVVIRPGFQEFVRFAREQGCPVTIASDGFGFYIEPILERFGCLEYIDTIYCNKALPREDGTLRIETPYRHPTCPVCGNCKPNHVLALKRQGWKVIYIGDGSNDRFGASWSDYIFARDWLAGQCKEQGIPFSPWKDFFDVIRTGGSPAANTITVSPFCRPEGEGYVY